MIIFNVNGMITLEDVHAGSTLGLTSGQLPGEITLPTGGSIDMDVVNIVIELRLTQNSSADLAASVTRGEVVVNNLTLQNKV
jgi:hypothetical protein